MFVKRLHELIDFFLFSNIFIALAAVCFTLQVELVFSIPLHLRLYHFVIFFATLAEYGIHRMVSVRGSEKSFELKQAQRWSTKRMKAQFVLLCIALAGLLVCSFYLKFEVFLLFCSVALITLAYTLPLFSKGGEIFRLRDLPVVKILFVAVVWSMVTVFPPLLYNDVSLNSPNVWIVFIQRIFFVFAITVPFDIRDAEEDSNAGIITLAVLFGKIKTLKFAYAAIALFILMQVLLVVIHEKISGIDLAIFISGISTLFFLSSERIKKVKHYHYGVLDGTITLQFLLVWISVQFF